MTRTLWVLKQTALWTETDPFFQQDAFIHSSLPGSSSLDKDDSDPNDSEVCSELDNPEEDESFVNKDESNDGDQLYVPEDESESAQSTSSETSSEVSNSVGSALVHVGA